jgi:hypothetical protein
MLREPQDYQTPGCNTRITQLLGATPLEPKEGSVASPFRHLITPELVARARKSLCFSMKRKYAEVLGPEYTVKAGPEVTNYEYRVLQMLDTIPDIPTPKPIDFFDIVLPQVDHFGRPIGGTETWQVMIISTVPGKDAGATCQQLKHEGLVKVLREVMDCMNRLDSTIDQGGISFPEQDGNWLPLQRPLDSISNLDGDKGRVIQLPFYGGLVPGSVPIRDFVSIMSVFNQQPIKTTELLASTLTYLGPGSPDDLRFCHMDLHLDDIMVKDGKLSGIIDWEFAGWFTW